ncbi:hypothetical protein C8J57DRAFT_1724374 [Mycena rebaudengoi]|nr:hypothetical protein C8J57DRAFT_1724374 [Mycena rebaudengoi]
MPPRISVPTHTWTSLMRASTVEPQSLASTKHSFSRRQTLPPTEIVDICKQANFPVKNITIAAASAQSPNTTAPADQNKRGAGSASATAAGTLLGLTAIVSFVL